MSGIQSKLEKISSVLEGRTITDDERDLIDLHFSEVYPKYLLEIVSKYNIVEQCFSMSDEKDISGMGVEMQWMNPKEQVEESFEVYPGIAVIKHGYIPFGKCLEGSGDPYFLNGNNHEPKVYRIPHEAVNGEEFDLSAIEYVCLIA